MAKNKPLDEKADFDNPVKKEQAPLLPDQDPVVPEMVQNGRFMATFLGPKKFSTDKDGNLQLTLEFSAQPLSPEFAKVLPEKIIDTWHYLVNTENPRADVDLEPANVSVFLDPKEKSPRIRLAPAQITSCTVSRVTSKGKGKTHVGMRLKFSAQYGQTDPLLLFAGNNHGRSFWLDFGLAQASLPVANAKA